MIIDNQMKKEDVTVWAAMALQEEVRERKAGADGRMTKEAHAESGEVNRTS